VTLSAPPAIECCAEGITRIRLSPDLSGARHSYLEARAWPAARATPAARIVADAIEILADADSPVLRLRLNDIQSAESSRLRIGIIGEQHFYGLGESGQQFDRLGATRRLWNSQANHGSGADMAIPLLVSNAGYALFFDNASQSMITPGDSVGPSAAIEYSTAEGPVDIYVLTGGSIRAVLGRVADLLGHAPMPPRWALGFMQSSRHFVDTDDVLSVTRTMREKRLPCDAFIFLSTYGPGQGWNRGVGHLEFHPDLIPDPRALISEMRANGFRVFGHEYPALHADSPLHAEAVSRGFLLDYGYPDERPFPPGVINYREGQRFIDFSQADARRWWWEAHRELVAVGIEGWWLDGGEGPPARTTLAAGSGAVLHNRYDLMRHQAFAEGEARDRANQRSFLLCRSGGPGMQRFGAAAWSGDIDCTFATLEQQVAVGLNMAMSGVPYWGTDIGGFYKVAPDNTELFIRWFQFGAFCPVFRAHGHSWREHLPWSHGAEAEAICRRYLELRYRLLPYTYTLAYEAHRDGVPLMRPLVLSEATDPRFWQCGTQYLWGENLLVAPVTRAGATHWPVSFPAAAFRARRLHHSVRSAQAVRRRGVGYGGRAAHPPSCLRQGDALRG
jgi:alpha-glucosidase (family GH31 glycosyl hydrolase)